MIQSLGIRFKNRFLFLLVLTFSVTVYLPGCASNPNSTLGPAKKAETDSIGNVPISFLTPEFSRSLTLPDIPNTLPQFVGFKENVGYFTVSYVGKDLQNRSYWNLDSKSQFQEGHLDSIINSEDENTISESISHYLRQHEEDYYIIAYFLPIQYTIPLEGDEFELSANAQCIYYLYENKTWNKIAQKDATIFTEQNVGYLYALILAYQNKSSRKIPTAFQGRYSVSVKTDYTATGWASITYNFAISDTAVELTTTTYHEPIICNGNYFALDSANTLNLYYGGISGICIKSNPSFQIRQRALGFEIKGIGGEGTLSEWMLLHKE